MKRNKLAKIERIIEDAEEEIERGLSLNRKHVVKAWAYDKIKEALDI